MMGRRTRTGLLVVLLLAAAGFMLVYVPAQLVAQYKQIETWGKGWIIAYFTVVGLGTSLLLGSTGWIGWRIWAATRRKRQSLERRRKNPSELDSSDQQQEIEANLASLTDLQQDPSVSPEVKQQLEDLLREFQQKQADQELEIVAFGTISSGKSSLLNALAGRDVFQTDAKGGTTVTRNEIPWPGVDRVFLVDTPGLGEVQGVDRAAVAADAAKDADVVLLVVDGPLRGSEHELLTQLGQMEKRVLVCLNKMDWYSDRERDALRGQIAEQVDGLVAARDIVGVQAQVVKRRRVRVLSDGTEREEFIDEPPDIGALGDRMLDVVRRDGRDLLLANLLLQSRGLVNEARNRVEEAIDERARELVDKYAWGAGGAAALSPFPVLDLLAGGAITTKMVVDLARLYRQELDTETAVRLLGQLGKNLLAILGVSAATPLVVTTIASLLKSVPGAGTLAGGMLQGLVQVLVTRWIGAVFIQYFKTEMKTTPAGLAEVARDQWKRLTTVGEMRQLVTAYLSRREKK